MATTIYTQTDYHALRVAQTATRTRVFRGFGKAMLIVAPMAGYFFLWAPIVLLVLFSFNTSESLATWHGFSFRWYETIFSGAIGTGGPAAFSSRQMLSALSNSLLVALWSTVIATTIGTMVAISLVKGNYPFKRVLKGLIFTPMVLPDIAQGVSLAMFFKIVLDLITAMTGERAVQGFASIIIGHVAFNISYVAIVVMARMADMNPRYEEAAADLGANPWRAFWRVTFPLILPGVLAGGLLALTMSLDDFIVTYFLSGVGNSTLPIYVFSLIKDSITPEINAISTLMVMLSTLLIGVSLFFQGNSFKRSNL